MAGKQIFCGYCFKDLFNRECSILEYFSSSFFSYHFVKVQSVQPYSSTDTATPGRLEFHMIESLSIAVYTFFMQKLTSISVKDMLLPKEVNWSTNLKGLPFNV